MAALLRKGGPRRCHSPWARRLEAAPGFVGGARLVALEQVLQPGGAVVQAAGSVAGEPELPVVLDERSQGGSQLRSFRLRYGGQPAVLGQAGLGVATQQGHELRGRAQLVLDEV